MCGPELGGSESESGGGEEGLDGHGNPERRGESARRKGVEGAGYRKPEKSATVPEQDSREKPVNLQNVLQIGTNLGRNGLATVPEFWYLDGTFGVRSRRSGLRGLFKERL
jgi:hypothetical protein